MKHYRLITILAAMAAMVSCNIMEERLPEEPGVLTFTASLGVDTRTSLNDDKTVAWLKGDKITVFDASGKSEEFTVPKDCDRFTFTSDGTLGSSPYYAVSGYGSTKPTFNTSSSNILLSELVTDGSFASADLIAAKTSGNSFAFSHVTGFIKFSVEDENVTGISFTTEGIDGTQNIRIGFHSSDNGFNSYFDSSNTVSIDGITGPGTYYAAVKPGIYSNGFAIQISCGETHKRVISDKTFKISAGQILDFGTIGESRITGEDGWSLVRSLSDITNNSIVIIAALTENKAMGGSSYGGFSASDITKNADRSKLVGNPNAQAFVITWRGADTYTFRNANTGRYLACGSDGSLSLQSTLDNKSYWRIKMKNPENGYLEINSRAYGSYYIQYYSSKALFKGFNSEAVPVVLYRNSSTSNNPTLEEYSSLTDETVWGVYKYEGSTDQLTSLYQYNVRNGKSSSGKDQWARKNLSSGVSLRIQSLSDQHLASLTFETSNFTVGNTYTATVFAYGVDGLSNGTSNINLKLKKYADNTLWFLEDGGKMAFILPFK